MCTKTRGGAGPATRDGGGRGGASAFPVRGQRTRIEEACMSTVGMWRCDSHTQFGRKWAEGGCRRWGGPRASPASGGTGSRRFRPREVRGSNRAGREVGGEGEEASGTWDLGGVEWLRRILVSARWSA
jgi:hypothetical protein